MYILQPFIKKESKFKGTLHFVFIPNLSRFPTDIFKKFKIYYFSDFLYWEVAIAVGCTAGPIYFLIFKSPEAKNTSLLIFLSIYIVSIYTDEGYLKCK